MSFSPGGKHRIGACALMMFAGPNSVDMRSGWILSVPTTGGSTKASSVFLIAKPTPCKRGSSGGFPCLSQGATASQVHFLEANEVDVETGELSVIDSILSCIVDLL